MQRPNILITGVPGTGKTTVANLISENTGLTYFNVGDFVREHQLHEGWDEEFATYILNEDALLTEMTPLIENKGLVVEFHSPAVFPEDWFDLVIVLTCINDVLYPRLEARGYNEDKIQDNIESEIMEVVLDEARECFEDKVIVFPCEELSHIDAVVSAVTNFLSQYS
ncbi:hypothetical protein P9112_005265 [Eukaryota sp. TZLM1-RC]